MTAEQDRTVHAINKDRRIVLVRYNRAGAWYRETLAGTKPKRLTSRLSLFSAVLEAVEMGTHGGEIFWGRRGWTMFDKQCRDQLSLLEAR